MPLEAGEHGPVVVRSQYLELIPAEYREKVAGDQYFQGMLAELDADSNLTQLYVETILYRNQGPLIEKTRQQIHALEEMYFEKEQSLFSDLIGEMKKRTRNARKRLKLEQFQKFIDAMAVIKGGTRDFDETRQEFVSKGISDPEHAYAGSYDIPLCAHNYTYCSFDDISHPQAVGKAATNDVRVIDESDFQGRAEILMMDIADLTTTAHYKDNHRSMKAFLENLFDYEGGKKILALYCALIFENVEEAREFFHRNIGRTAAGSWYKSPEFVPILRKKEPERFDLSLSSLSDSEGKHMMHLLDKHDRMKADPTPSMKRLLDIQKTMISVYEKTGIVPPLTLEVRVPQRAHVKHGAAFNDWTRKH